jgi:hypothetical protein
MANEDRYKVVIGMSIVKEGTPGFADFGISYHNLPYDMMVQVEAAMAKHADAINEGLKPLVADLVGMGVEEAKVRKGNS